MFLAIFVFWLKEGKLGSSEMEEDEDETESWPLSLSLEDCSSFFGEEEKSSGLIGEEGETGRTAQEANKNKELINKIVLFIYFIT